MVDKHLEPGWSGDGDAQQHPGRKEIRRLQNYGTHHLQQWSFQHQIHSGPLHIEQDKTPHQKGQTLQDKPVLQPFNRLKAQR